MKNKIKIVLAGTPNFSVSTFEEIMQNFNVVALISQPNKAIGRHKKIDDTPTVKLARKYQIRIFQPNKIIEIYEELKELNFDFFITMAYGQIIPEKILNLAHLGSFNIHASLLPKYRGAAPIQYALLNGENETGITFMHMIAQMDAGDIIFQEKISIEEQDNYDSLLIKLANLAKSNIKKWINNLITNNYQKIKQDRALVSFSSKISKEDELIKITSIKDVLNQVRALSSIPGAYTFVNNLKKNNQDLSKDSRRIKIYRVSKLEIKNTFIIECSDGLLYLKEYQIEGKRKIIL